MSNKLCIANIGEGVEVIQGKVLVGKDGGAVSYDILGNIESGYQGEIVLFWSAEQDDRSADRFDETGLSTGIGVQQIEAISRWVLEDMVKLDDGDDCGRGYSLFCQIASYLPRDC